MNYFFPYGLIWHPDSSAVWIVPMVMIFTILLIKGISKELHRSKILLVVYSIGLVYNLISIISELTFLDLHISNDYFNYIWLVNILIIGYEYYLSSKRLKTKKLVKNENTSSGKEKE